jgi:hypothetical protein
MSIIGGDFHTRYQQIAMLGVIFTPPSNPSRGWGVRATSTERNLSGDYFRGRVSFALLTTPIPPPPNGSTMR